MTGDGFLCRSGDLAPRGQIGPGHHSGHSPLTIALINNMPDAALRATERQFCSLLSSASTGLHVQLKFYTLPGVKRSEIAQAHIDSFYEDFRSLEHEPPDGLIMTGTEPLAASLKDEAYWPPMAHLINLCHDRGVPGVWSCLAAHAAVMEIDGIQRLRLPRKLSGVFTCRINSSKHQIFHRMPNTWRIPHSRLNGLRHVDLERKGYDIVSGSSEIGVDIFIKRYDCMQVFLHGHPEYDVDTLTGEFRRDVLRALNGQRTIMPDLPAGFRSRELGITLRQLQAAFDEGNTAEPRACLDAIISQLEPEKSWASHARKLFENWLAYVDARKHQVSGVYSIHA